MPQLPPDRRHLTLLTSLYAAQGLPFGFFTLALPVLLREAGWSLTAIGFLQFLGLPWALKFLWAPWLDHHGSRRGWLLGLQGAAVAMALVLSQLGLQAGSVALLAAVFIFNLIAATQDVVTDGLAVRLLTARGRGLANAVQVGAFRLGMVLGGGLLLWVFARSGWEMMFLGMAALLALSTAPVWSMREPASVATTHDMPTLPRRPTARQLVLILLKRACAPGMLGMAAMIFAYRFGDQLASALFTPYLTDQGVGKETIALMKGAVGSGTALLGAALGGWLMLRVGRRSALLFSGLAQVAAFGLYVVSAWGWGGTPLLWVATVAEGVTSSMAAVALFALMMDTADPAHAGTDYTLLASVVVLVTSLGSLAGGLLGDALGYAATFSAGTLLTLVGCLVMVAWLDRYPTHARVAQAWR